MRLVSICDDGYLTGVFDTARLADKDRILEFLNSFEAEYRTGAFFHDSVRDEMVNPKRYEVYRYGAWCWDSGNIYCFERYDIVLDPRFLKDVLGIA